MENNSLTPDLKVRVDVWVWATRLTKTRALAAAGAKNGHVRVNDDKVKPSTTVKIGDSIRVWSEAGEKIVEVTKLINKRVGAPIAVTCYIDHTPAPLPKEERVIVAQRERGTGRPTKRERRDLDKLRGRATN